MGNESTPGVGSRGGRVRRNTVLVGIGLLLAAILLGRYRYNLKHKVIILDFTKSHSVSQIPLPDLNWPGDFEGWDDGYVDLHLPGSISYEGNVSFLGFRRQGGSVTSVYLNLDDGAVDRVFAKALELAKSWNLPTEPLEKWHSKVNQYGLRFQDLPVSERHDVEPAIGLEIRYSFDDARPVFISLDFVWQASLNPAGNAASEPSVMPRTTMFDKAAFQAWASGD
jgi:hypothetical protein